MNQIYNTPILHNITFPRIQFRSKSAVSPGTFEAPTDSFSSNSVNSDIWNKNTITNIAKLNPEIRNILNQNKIPLKINDLELEKLKKGHLTDTRIIAAKIYSALPQNIKSQINTTDLQQAAMLHDYGKVLIPEKILNKKGKLTDEEKRIMALHSELGYELLSKQGINENVLNLIKYHHQTPVGNGYPKITNDFMPDTALQVLTAADKYSALTEKRSYKDAMKREEALEILSQDVQEGLISKEVFESLKKVV